MPFSASSPLVGITLGRQKPGTESSFLRVRPSYPRAIAAAGGAPLLIPLEVDPEALRQTYERLDALLLTGGGDIHPACYKAETSLFTEDVDCERDEIEMQLVRWAVTDDKPLLGICRGTQVLNVALGGTLIQDIREEVAGSLRHDAPSDDWFSRLSHPVTVTLGSLLQKALGIDQERLAVNSLHHQAIGTVAPDLQVVARADDRIIEGIVHPGCRFVLGVQWHPETLFDHHEPQRRLLQALVDAARQHMADG